MDALIDSSRWLDVIEKRDTSPLIRAGLIADAVAIKTTSQMTCEQYMQLSDIDFIKKTQLEKCKVVTKPFSVNMWVDGDLSTPY